MVISLPSKALASAIGWSYQEFLRTTALSPQLASRQQEIRLPLADQEFFVNYPDQLHGILLINEEAPELLVVVPILARIAAACGRMSLQIVRDTDDLTPLTHLVGDLDLLELELPQLLLFDEEWELQGQWGPHPQEVERLLDEWLERHPEYEQLATQETPAAQTQFAQLSDQLTHEMRLWYNSGLNAACVREIHALLASWLETEPTDDGEQDKDW